MNTKRVISTILATAVLFAAWQIAGHWLIMPLPMAERHLVDFTVGTLLTLAIVWFAVTAILRQRRDLEELARMRDYLVRMEAHYLHLNPATHLGAGHFQVQALSDEFMLTAHGLASATPSVRAHSVVGLTDLATQTVAGNSGITGDATYPLFRRAAAHLSVAAYSEKDPLVRGEIGRSFVRLADFARDKPFGLRCLIADMAHTNRTCLRAFRGALVEVVSKDGLMRPEGLSLSLPMAGFGIQPEMALRILEDLVVADDFRSSVALGSTTNGESDSDTQRNQLECRAQILCSSRDLLAYGMRNLHKGVSGSGQPDDAGNEHTDIQVDLSGCFLACADLKDAYLRGVNLQASHLQFAALEGAVLDDADLTGAYLRGAHMQACSARSARMFAAFMDNAGLSAAHLEGADLCRAKLDGAYLIGAHLDKTRLWKAVFQTEHGEASSRADFTQANWWDASFTEPVSGDTDRGARAWLHALYPEPETNTVAASPTTTMLPAA